MDNNFIRKTGKAISAVASELILLNVNDKIPSVSELVEKYQFSRGTIQNALHFLRDSQLIKLSTRGHLGTFLLEIDYLALQKYLGQGVLRGTMPLPYSKMYEGFATGLHTCFSSADLSLNMAYVRGGKERISLVVDKVYQFAVVSKFYADYMISLGMPITITKNFGEKSYVKEHALFFHDKSMTKIVNGMKVGVDSKSHDHLLLTKEVTKDYKVILIELSSYQILKALNRGIIDCCVWNVDEIFEQNIKFNFQKLENSKILSEVTTAVMVTHSSDKITQAIFSKVIDEKIILKTQEEVVTGKKIPMY